jgi:hypothetical protein
MPFPANWPIGCPPPEAIGAAGEVYRIVKGQLPDHTDFATHFELGRLPRAPACLRCGLSVFRDIRDAQHQRLLLPKLGRWIAKAALVADHGKTMLTMGSQPTHTTWWAYVAVDRASLFAVVSEED